jgi:hypothetical protein
MACQVPGSNTNEVEAGLLAAAEQAKGLSGRTLRKLPFLAHATYLQSTEPCTAAEFTIALQSSIADEHASRKALSMGGPAVEGIS